MRRRPFVSAVAAATAAALGSVLAAATLADSGEPPPGRVDDAAREIDPRTVGVGELVPDLALRLADGATRRLSALAGPKGLVVLVRSEACPVGRRQGPDLPAIEAQAAAKGLAVVYLNVATAETESAARDAATAYGIRAPYALDAGRAAAAALGVRTTTEAFVLDRARTLVYRGAIDDRYGVGHARAAASHAWLLRAIDAAAAGRRPLVEATTAPGCAVAIDPAKTPPAPAPTWHGRVSRIFDRNCADCHRAGDAGPFPLLTRDDVLAQADMVKVVVANRTMPPWFAGEACGEFATDASLSARDREAVLAWIEAGLPVGDPADAAAPAERAPGWRIGEPDLVLEVPEAIDVPASGVVEYQYRWVATGLEEDRWVTAVEVRPSAPEVVHHVLVFPRFRKKDPRAATQGPFDGGVSGYFAATVPGQGHFVYPEGHAKKLPAGTDLLFQIHYQPNGRAARDRPRIGLRFAPTPPAHEVRTRGVYDMKFKIPPGAERHPVHAVWTFPQRARILEFMPHMHVRGTAFRYELELPDGARRTLLDIPRYDFDWQIVYRLREPLEVPRGARVHATGWFDNSATNPSNPDPTRTVPFGDQTTDEMMIGYFDWVPLE